MIRRPLDRAGLCVCGVSVALHSNRHNRKVSCEAARKVFARVRPQRPPTAPVHPDYRRGLDA